jgi:hypothetical protein
MSQIVYTQGKKYAYFNGVKFTRDDKTGYYLNSTLLVRLHRYVWEYFNGVIPEGMQIHHIDCDKGNNDISNLELLKTTKHQRFHGKERAINDPKWLKKFHEKGIEEAKKWHKSKEGRQWHKKHYENMKDSLYQYKEFICEQCNKEFKAIDNGIVRFCSNKCKSAWRRESGVDDETRNCEFCKTTFITNKYTKQRFCSKVCSNRAIPRLPQLRCSG